MKRDQQRKHAAELARVAAGSAALLQAEPDDFFARVAAKNNADAAEDAAKAVAIADAEEAGELVDLRLLGPRADGSVSLDWFISAIAPLSRAWKLAAYRLRHGSEAPKHVGDEISRELNLKLAGLAYGSTRILMTGNGLPDLTGVSLLQATLTQTFRLLNSGNAEFFDAVDAVGGRAAHQFGGFLKSLDAAGFASELTWLSPKGREHWQGRPDEITRLRALLDTLKDPEQFEETVVGRVGSVADTGRIDLRTEDGKLLIRFPLDLTEQVRRLTITALVELRVQTSMYWDSVEKKKVFKRRLIEVQRVSK
jgi:hypothetical protein